MTPQPRAVTDIEQSIPIADPPKAVRIEYKKTPLEKRTVMNVFAHVMGTFEADIASMDRHRMNTVRHLCEEWGMCQQRLHFSEHGWADVSSTKRLCDSIADVSAVNKAYNRLIGAVRVQRTSGAEIALLMGETCRRVRVPRLKGAISGTSQFSEELYTLNAVHVARAIKGVPCRGPLGDQPHMPRAWYQLLFMHFVIRGIEYGDRGKKWDVDDCCDALNIGRDRYNDLLEKTLIWIAARLPIEVCGHNQPVKSGVISYNGMQGESKTTNSNVVQFKPDPKFASP
jgi:hypothetical protein